MFICQQNFAKLKCSLKILHDKHLHCTIELKEIAMFCIFQLSVCRQERDHNMRVEELQGEITQRERHITNLKEDTNNLQTTISHLNKEIEFKRQEISKIKSDTAHQIRYSNTYLSRIVRKPDFCLRENKGADQLCSNCEADQCLCFCYTVQFLFFLNPQFQASNLLLWLYRLVCVRPGRLPR